MSDIDDSVPQSPSKDPARSDDRHGSGFDVATRLVHAGSDPARFNGVVNPPVYRASTMISQNLAELRRKREIHASGERAYGYGRFGTPTTHAFEDAVAELEGGYRSLVFPSGLAACTCALTAFVGKDDHILVPENAYFPLRNFARTTLARFGVEVEFYQPLDVAGTIARIRDNTRVLYVESPGSITFEVQDIPALAAGAHQRGVTVLMDNTWATPLYFKPFAHGVDVSIQAGTKYLVGHSDAFLGVVTATRESWEKLQQGARQFGQIAGPDDVYLALRGLRTLQVRLERHWRNGVELANWLGSQPLVQQVLHPALPSDPGYALWKRDFTGASGLFGFQLAPLPEAALSAFFDHLELFKLGYSWGGYESLIMLYQPHDVALASRTNVGGALVRIHAGLEHVDDLRADLHAAFKRLAG
jgi:cystathionine beta-lyase